MEIGLTRGEDGAIEHAIVKRRDYDKLEQPIGVANDNPHLDTREYDIEYLNGTIETIPANLIAENLLSQVNEKGHLLQ